MDEFYNIFYEIWPQSKQRWCKRHTLKHVWKDVLKTSLYRVEDKKKKQIKSIGVIEMCWPCSVVLCVKLCNHCCLHVCTPLAMVRFSAMPCIFPGMAMLHWFWLYIVFDSLCLYSCQTPVVPEGWENHSCCFFPLYSFPICCLHVWPPGLGLSRPICSPAMPVVAIFQTAAMQNLGTMSFCVPHWFGILTQCFTFGLVVFVMNGANKHVQDNALCSNIRFIYLFIF